MTAIRNPSEFFEGAGITATGDGDDCQSTGVAHTPLSAPWRGDPHEQAKTLLFRYVRNTPQGTPIQQVVTDVFGDDGDDSKICARTARRFFERYPELFKTDSRGDMTWVQPRLGCFKSVNLRQQYASGKTSVGRGDDSNPSPNSSKTVATDSGGDQDLHIGGDDGAGKYAKERTQSYLDNYLMVDSDSVKKSLLKQFATGKAGTEDKWQIFRRLRGSGDPYLRLPYKTRFNDDSRARSIRLTFEQALERAGNRYNRAVVLTLTTDPKRHDGLSDALESLSDNKARLMSWLSTDYQLGHRPANLTALEFTESGLPHLHVVLFGVAGGISQKQLSEKWRGYGQASVVDLRQAKTTHTGTQWRLHDDDAGTQTLRQYLGKAIRGLQTVASADAEELRDRIDAGDVSLWKQALYWATERQYVTCSPSLRASNDDGDGDSLPAIKIWEFVGVARAEEIPAHVWESASVGVG